MQDCKCQDPMGADWVRHQFHDPWGLGKPKDWKAEQAYLERQFVLARDAHQRQVQRTSEVYGSNLPASSHDAIQALKAASAEALETLTAFKADYLA